MKGIITADWHLRDDRPLCRLDDDWHESQRKCIEHVIKIANEKECNIYIVGDLFHRPVVNPKTINMFLKEMDKLDNELFCFIYPGNHDIQFGNIDNIDNSSLGIVLNSKHPRILRLFNQEGSKYLFSHQLVFKSEKNIPPNCEGIIALELAKKHPNKSYIFLGDNHKAFMWEKSGHPTIINPGCLIRQNANEIDYTAFIYYVDTDKHIKESIIGADNDNDKYLTRDHLKKKEERNERIETFIESLKTKRNISLNYEENLRIVLKDKNVKKETKEIIEELLLEVK